MHPSGMQNNVGISFMELAIVSTGPGSNLSTVKEHAPSQSKGHSPYMSSIVCVCQISSYVHCMCHKLQWPYVALLVQTHQYLKFYNPPYSRTLFQPNSSPYVISICLLDLQGTSGNVASRCQIIQQPSRRLTCHSNSDPWTTRSASFQRNRLLWEAILVATLATVFLCLAYQCVYITMLTEQPGITQVIFPPAGNPASSARPRPAG